MEKRNGEGSFFWAEEPNDQTSVPMKHKRKVKPKKMEFIGWGSKPLIEFLVSIGVDSNKQLSQYEVAAVINEYVHKLNLFHPVKKKKILCDERLHYLFGKKSVPRIKIYDLLESHFAENQGSSEDDLLDSSEDLEEDVHIKCKKQKNCSAEKKATYQKIKVSVTPRSCFAAIIPENIKLIYLKRSLVQDLLKYPESFEGKLIGSYIRIKSDPNDYSQKNSHQLLPVTGVKNAHGDGDAGKQILLQVPNVVKDIRICMLSDDDFLKEECEDLCQRVKDGLLKRPTVVELEQKACILHEDIIKHWLPRELAYLQNLIDQANEKGWRKAFTLFEYLQKRQLLQTPSEQSRLLLELPKIIPDELEPEATPQDPVEDVKHLGISSPTSIVRDASHISADSGANQRLSSHSSDAAENKPVDLVRENKHDGGTINHESSGGVQATSFQWIEDTQVYKVGSLCHTMGLDKVSQVIELSDDDGDDEDKDATKRKQEHYNFAFRYWYYFDPQGQVQGPVSRNELKRWFDGGYFLPDFKIWKAGQTPDKAILLTDLLLAVDHD